MLLSYVLVNYNPNLCHLQLIKEHLEIERGVISIWKFRIAITYLDQQTKHANRKKFMVCETSRLCMLLSCVYLLLAYCLQPTMH